MRHGLVVGKFHPLHAGHSHLIDHALERCDRVTVLLLANSAETIPVEVRHRWIEEVHPSAHVVSSTADHPIDYDDPVVWDLWEAEIRALLDAPVDVVFSSERYGDELARRLDARSEIVDLDRATVPVSGTAVRRDPAANWEYLSPPVRAWFVHRIAIVGAESSGTTTLTRALAEHYGAAWVPEYGRAYTVDKIAREGVDSPWRSEEFVHIARRQLELEDAAARESGVPLLLCDTDALATASWHEQQQRERRDESIEADAARHHEAEQVVADQIHRGPGDGEDRHRERILGMRDEQLVAHRGQDDADHDHEVHVRERITSELARLLGVVQPLT